MRCYEPFETDARLAVAVSGGVDSMVLALLSQQWCHSRHFDLQALIVDHGLRSQAKQDALAVKKQLATYAIEAHVFHHNHAPAKANLQAWARQYRYHQMETWCAKQGIFHLLVGHHLDDQFETFFLRLSRGSGIYGLTAMKKEHFLHSVRLLRPLLSVPKQAILATADACGLTTYIDDPSNQHPRFARSRIRKMASFFADEGLTPIRLKKTIAAMARARNSLETMMAQTIRERLCVFPYGYASLHRDALLVHGEEIGMQILARVLRLIAGRTILPRLDATHRLYRKLMTGNNPCGHTLHGCMLTQRDQSAWMTIMREPASVTEEKTITSQTCFLWDQRFRIQYRMNRRRALVCKALQEKGRLLLKEKSPFFVGRIPLSVYQTLPSLWHRDNLEMIFSPQGDGFLFPSWQACHVSMVFSPPCSIT